MINFFLLQTVPISFIKCDFDLLFIFLMRLRDQLEDVIIKVKLNDLRSVAAKNLFFLCRNLNLALILLINFRNIDCLTFFASNMQPTYVTFEFCLIWIVLSVIFSFGAFFISRVAAKSLNLGVHLPKWIVSLLSKNHSQRW